MSTVPAKFDFDTTVAAAVPPGSTLLCLAPDRDDEIAMAQTATIELAARVDGAVVLYDRADERLVDTPEQSHLVGLDEVDLDESEHLRPAVAMARSAGVPVSVWRSVMPSLGTGLVRAIQHASVHAVVLPDHGGRGSIFDRWLERGSDIDTIVDELFAQPVFGDATSRLALLVVTDDGTVIVKRTL